MASIESSDEAPAPPPLTRHDGRSHPVRRLAAVSVTATILAAGLYWSTVGTRTGQLLGELILGGRPISSETVRAAEGILAVLSRATLAVGVLVLATIAWFQERPRLALVAVATVAGANLTTQLLKSVVLDRSDLLDGLFYPLPNSFPSGHVTAAASIAVAAILVLPPLLRSPAVVVSAIIVGLVGASTLLTGWHRMADAVGGIFVATAWGAGLAAVLAWRRGVDVVGRRTAILGRYSSSVPIVLGAGIVAVGAVAYVLVAMDPLGVLDYLARQGGSPALFWAAVAFTMGMSCIALGTLGMALRDVGLDPRTREPRSSSTEGSAIRADDASGGASA